MSKKTLEELVFHDDFMFAAVMMQKTADVSWNVCWRSRLKELRSAQNMVSFSIRNVRVFAWTYLQKMKTGRIMILRCSW